LKALCDKPTTGTFLAFWQGNSNLPKANKIKNTTQPIRRGLEVALLGLFSTVNSHQPEEYSLRQHSEHSRASITAQQPAPPAICPSTQLMPET